MEQTLVDALASARNALIAGVVWLGGAGLWAAHWYSAWWQDPTLADREVAVVRSGRHIARRRRTRSQPSLAERAMAHVGVRAGVSAPGCGGAGWAVRPVGRPLRGWRWISLGSGRGGPRRPSDQRCGGVLAGGEDLQDGQLRGRILPVSLHDQEVAGSPGGSFCVEMPVRMAGHAQGDVAAGGFSPGFLAGDVTAWRCATGAGSGRVTLQEHRSGDTEQAGRSPWGVVMVATRRGVCGPTGSWVESQARVAARRD